MGQEGNGGRIGFFSRILVAFSATAFVRGGLPLPLLGTTSVAAIVWALSVLRVSGTHGRASPGVGVLCWARSETDPPSLWEALGKAFLARTAWGADKRTATLAKTLQEGVGGPSQEGQAPFGLKAVRLAGLPKGHGCLYLLGWSTAMPALKAIVAGPPKRSHVKGQISPEDQERPDISCPQPDWSAENPGQISPWEGGSLRGGAEAAEEL